LDSILSNAAPTADQASDLPQQCPRVTAQTLANLEIVLDMLKRYHSGVEQLLVILPQASSIIQTLLAADPRLREFSRSTCLSTTRHPVLPAFLPASEWRSPADMSPAPLPKGTYCKIPKDSTLAVRGARNLPCVDVPGKRAATPTECRSNKPYVPLGTNPWYGDPNQDRELPCACSAAVIRGWIPAGSSRHRASTTA